MAEPFTAIILAAQRAGVVNPIAHAHGVTHKCLAPIAGRPLIAHVIEALSATPGLALIRIVVERDAFALLEPLLIGRVDLVEAHPGIADSVLAAAKGRDGPFIVTTADNVLLTREAVESVLDAMASGAEAVAVLATRESVLAVHPEAQRGFYEFSEAAYANCNLYGLAGKRALGAAEIFRSGGQFMKNPKRLADAFGLLNIVLMRFRLLSLAGAMKRLSKRFGFRFEALVPADGTQAIDVDNERTYRIAEGVLKAR